MIKDPARRTQLANLSLIACGVMPAAMAFLQLGKANLAWPLWQSNTRVNEFGLTYDGNILLIELLCEELELEQEPILESTEECLPNQTELGEGTVFLRQVAQAVENGSKIEGGMQDVKLARLVANVSPVPMKDPTEVPKLDV